MILISYKIHSGNVTIMCDTISGGAMTAATQSSAKYAYFLTFDMPIGVIIPRRVKNNIMIGN